MSSMNKWCSSLLVLVVVVAVGVRANGGEAKPEGKAKAEAKDKNVAEAKDKAKAEVSTGLSQAALAAQLALEGEKRKSPTLLLAAAELLGELKDSPKESAAKKEPGKKKVADKTPPKLDVQELVDAAAKYAKGDEKLSALIESRREQLASRGLTLVQGIGKRSVVVGGVTFKVIDEGVIGARDEIRLTNVVFEGDKPAVVLVAGDGDGDLDLWVYDGNTGGLIGKDTDATSNCMVAWVPRYEGPFTVRIANVGQIAEKYFILANW